MRWLNPSSPSSPSRNSGATTARHSGSGSGWRPLRGQSDGIAQGVSRWPIGVTVKAATDTSLGRLAWEPARPDVFLPQRGEKSMSDIGRRVLLASLLATPALAQAPWPTRPIRFISPFAPGGPQEV